MDIGRRMAAEFIGAFWLVFGGCGSAVIAAGFPDVGIGLLGVSFAFGLTVVTGAYAFGHISGGHFNPAVTAGLWAGGRFPMNEILPYWASQVLGGISGAGVLYLIAVGGPSFDPTAGFASNGYGEHSPGGYSLASGAIAEALLAAMFLLVILGVTGKERARRLRAARDRTRLDVDSLDQHSRNEHVGEPSSQPGTSGLRAKLGA